MKELSDFFKKSELIPAIIQDVATKNVLMLAYMNETSLRKTLESGTTWFYSRSRQCLWNKGANSGNLQYVKSIEYDCDDDTLLIKVNQVGVACHTGSYSCFNNNLYGEEVDSDMNVLNDLYKAVADRKRIRRKVHIPATCLIKDLIKYLKKSVKNAVKQLLLLKITITDN